MKLLLLTFILIIISLTSTSAILAPTFEPCSDSYYEKIWETVLKEPYTGIIKPSVYHEGPDMNGQCSNFDINLTKAGSGYKEVFFLLVTISQDKKELFAGHFKIADPDGKWQLPGDFAQRFYTYLYSTYNAQDRSSIISDTNAAKTEYETYFNGVTDINIWKPPTCINQPCLTGLFTYLETASNKQEQINVNKRQFYSSYDYTELNQASITTTTTSSTTSSSSRVICNQGDTKHCDLPGVCSLGVQVCTNNAWSECSIGPTKEICNDGLDNNCNGIIDENCLCQEGTSRPCGINIGICSFGNQTCINGKWSDKCDNTVLPRAINCTNMLDNDCNNIIDANEPACKQQNIVINLCNDNKTDFDETGIDCGGSSCPPCQSCTDGILNEGETNVNAIIDANGRKSDCGGPNCPACPTCDDGIQNQGEEGIDCGGPCANKCNLENNSINTKSICGDGVCDSSSENADNCPQDCSSTPIIPIIIIFFVCIPILGIILYLLIKKRTKKTKDQVFKIHSSFLKPAYKGSNQDKLTEELKKIK